MALINLPQAAKPWIAWIGWTVVWSSILYMEIQKDTVLSQFNVAFAFIFLAIGIVVAAYKLNEHFGIVAFN